MSRLRFVAIIGILMASTLADGAPALAQDEKPKAAMELRIITKKDAYVLDTGGATRDEYQKSLKRIEAEQKKKAGFDGRLPPAPKVELVLSIVNTGKEDVTVFVGGDPNVFTWTLKGPGVVALNSGGAFTTDFRLGRGVKLEPGKSHDIPIKMLMDGFRAASRSVYWTEPGEYTLSATYQLSGDDGAKGPLLTSKPIKLKVTEGN